LNDSSQQLTSQTWLKAIPYSKQLTSVVLVQISSALNSASCSRRAFWCLQDLQEQEKDHDEAAQPHCWTGSTLA